MDWLEKEKKVLSNNEAITSEIVAAAHIENYAMKLFSWAYNEDVNSNFSKNVVKAFYTSSMLFDVMGVFGEISPENAQAHKYAKWKAAYLHNCLKAGETPVPGPAASGNPDNELLPTIPTPQVAPDPENPAPQSPAHVTGAGGVDDAVAGPSAAAVAPAAAAAYQPYEEPSGSGISPQLSHDQVEKGRKLCKFAISALDYDDKAAAIDNLEKALNLLKMQQ